MRPQIICHMMSSVDGRILGDRWTRPFDGTDFDSAVQCYYDISNDMKADAIMFGRKTIQVDLIQTTFDHQGKVPAQNFETYLAPRSSKRICLVMDTQGKIRFTESQIMGEDVMLILGHHVSEAYLEHLRQLNISYLFVGENSHDLNALLSKLSELGFQKIIIEGGGILNASFLKAGFIDELSLLIYPGIDGLSGTQAVFEDLAKEGFPAKGQSLELLAVEQKAHGVVWLRYKFHR